MTIKAEIIKHSSSDNCPDIITFRLRYPRFIHSELMTHRVFSRNAASSRAIPIIRAIKDILRDPAMPISWGKNKPGMQSTETLPWWRGFLARRVWMFAMWCAIISAWTMNKLGVHKQFANRILEPWQHITVLVTATDWDNFFALRDHPDAQPEFRQLAQEMKVALSESTPQLLHSGMWHLPFTDGRGDQWKSFSAACCASVSYETVDRKPMTRERAKDIFLKLTGDPIHASPFEHVARPDPDNGEGCGNFTKWHQWRYDIENGEYE